MNNKELSIEELNEIKLNYKEVLNLLEEISEEINGADFYKFIFPNNQKKDELKNGKANAIFYYREKQTNKLKRRIMTSDTWEDDYNKFVVGSDFTLCSGLSYFGRANKLNNARQMYALIFDLDGVGKFELEALINGIENIEAGKVGSIPKPTFISLSGTGLHLYYVFEEPIELFPYIKIQLKALKYDLTFNIWSYKSTSKIENIQYQGIAQGFRMPGSINSKYGLEVKAFKYGDRITIDYLNKFVIREENKVDLNLPYRPTERISIEEAKLKYPQWYERKIIQKDKSITRWEIEKKVNGNNPQALYDWWKANYLKEIKGGHRYHFLLCMVIYGVKCNVPKEQVKEDMYKIFDELAEIKHTNALTEFDIKSALSSYDKELYTYRISDIEYLTGVRIPRNKRNYQKQEWHLEDMRNKKQSMKRRGQPFKNKEGRPSKEYVVRNWQKVNPNGTIKQCIEDTGLGKTTVYKWWK